MTPRLPDKDRRRKEVFGLIALALGVIGVEVGSQLLTGKSILDNIPKVQEKKKRPGKVIDVEYEVKE